MITPSSKIDWVIDNYFDQLVGLIRKSVTFSFAVCISCLFFFESISISVTGVDFAKIVVKSKIGALLPWLIIGVFYLLQIRSLYYMGRGLDSLRLRRANLDKEENAQDIQCAEYLLAKLRIQPSVFNPFSLVLWNAYSYWDLIIWAVELIVILPYAFFLINLWYFIQYIDGLETALHKEDKKTENKRAFIIAIICLGSFIIALSGSIIGEIAAPILLYVRIIQF
jgi:hypothetical protein